MSREGEDVTIATTGLMHHYALEAADALSGKASRPRSSTCVPCLPWTTARSPAPSRRPGKLVVVEEDVKTAGGAPR